MRNLDTQIRRGDAELVDDLCEVAHEVGVTDQPPAQVPVGAHVQTAPRGSRRRRGRTPEHGEVDDRQHGRVREDVDKPLRLDHPEPRMLPSGETLVSDDDPAPEVDDRLHIRGWMRP